MKRLITLLLLIAIIFTFTSCLKEDENPSGTEPTTTAITTTAPPAEYVAPSPTAYMHNTFSAKYVKYNYEFYDKNAPEGTEYSDRFTLKEGYLDREDTDALLSFFNNVDLDWSWGIGSVKGDERIYFTISNLRIQYNMRAGNVFERYLFWGLRLSEEDKNYINSLMEPYINGTKTFTPKDDEIEDVPVLLYDSAGLPSYTLAAQIKEGMTYAQVVEILGSEGVFFPRKSANMMYKIQKYWGLSNKKSLIIYFEDRSPDYADPYDVSNMEDWVVISIIEGSNNHK